MKKVLLCILISIICCVTVCVIANASEPETDSELSLFDALDKGFCSSNPDCEEIYIKDSMALFSAESSFADSFISNSENRKYINTMIDYYLKSQPELLNTLKSGKPVLMFFEGGSDNTDNSIYNSDNDYRISAVCIVLKYNQTTDSAYVAYANENCSTIPDHPLAYGAYNHDKGSEYGTATLKDGIYEIYTANHQSKYSGFNIRKNGVGFVPAVYMKSNGDYSEIDASGINIHTRTQSKVGSESSPWSAGCILVGASTPFSDYNTFIEMTAPTDSQRTKVTYKNNTIYKFSTGIGVSCGMIVIDRYLYRSKMSEIYKNQNAIDCITDFSVKCCSSAAQQGIANPEICVIHIDKNGNEYVEKVKLSNIEAPYHILIVGYNKDKFVTMERIPHDKQNSPYTLEGDIDCIKVMVWGGDSSLKPLAPSAKIK